MDKDACLPTYPPFIPIPTAPLHITPKGLSTLRRDTLAPTASSTHAQSLLEANVRHLVEMVDHLLQSTTHPQQTSLRIHVPVADSTGAPTVATVVHDCLLSPRTMAVARMDLSKVNPGVVSAMDNNTLLALFPSPPTNLDLKQQQQPSSRTKVIGNDKEHAPEGVLPLAHLLLSPFVDNKKKRHGVSFASPEASLAVCPLSLLEDICDNGDYSNLLHTSTLDEHTAVSSCPSNQADPSGQVASKVLERLDALLFDLFTFEAQMRRASFLSSAILQSTSTDTCTTASPTNLHPQLLDMNLPGHCDGDEDLQEAPLRPPTLQESSYFYRPKATSTCSCDSDIISQGSSSIANSARSSQTSLASTLLEGSSDGIKYPRALGAIKDADPALWETDQGQRWGDRFQWLVHNFQVAAGKHSKRLADIMPGSRFRRSRSRSLAQDAGPRRSGSRKVESTR